MYGITNRKIEAETGGPDILGKTVNENGPHELRVFEATQSSGDWRLEVIEDTLDDDKRNEVAPHDQPNEADAAANHGSYYIARKVFMQAQKEKRHVLFFVHGFNNDPEDVLDRAAELERKYKVIVVPFTWPANGGGVSGVASYKSDKNDAKASTVALDRAMAKAAGYLRAFTEEQRKEMWNTAQSRHPLDAEARNALYTRLLEKACPFTINALFHSMGNYVFKQLLKSTASLGNQFFFDNVVMVAADTNNLNHQRWVDKISCRRRVFITINENDHALAASRAKGGEEQLARLGHSLFSLNSERATYVDFTEASWVGTSHAYFEGSAASRNSRVREFFKGAFQGKAAERPMRYIPDKNVYEFK